MEIGVAVFDPLPLFRTGLLAALGSGGTDLATPEDLDDWASSGGGILFLTVFDEQLPAPQGLDLRRHDIVVVAVLEPYSVPLAARALRAGAMNVVARAGRPEDFRRTVDETRAGQLTLSSAVLRAATAEQRTNRDTSGVSNDEINWLRIIANGSSVAVLAEMSGFSERMMYRKLRGLYSRLGVVNRTQALILAQDEGWL